MASRTSTSTPAIGGHERPARDHPGPAREALRGLHVLGSLGAQPAGEGAHQRGQHGDRAHGDHGDDDRRADPHPSDEGDAGGQQAGDGHHDDRSRRHHRGAGGGVRHARGVADAVAARQLLSVAPDDQQRVVDARAEPEHDAERGREAGEVGEGAGELQQQQAARQRDQRRDQRQRHRRHRAEHEREHDDRHRHADQLADRGGGLLGLVHDRPVAGDLEAGALAELGRLLEPLARLLAERGGGVVVLDRHVGDAPVLGELAAVLARTGSARPSRAAGRAISSIVRSIAARRSGSRSVPDSTAKTTFAVSPDAAGKRSSSTSIALCDSVPGVLKSSTNEPPPAPAARPSATSTTATIASERFQCCAAQAARFPRRCAMAGEESTSCANLQ